MVCGKNLIYSITSLAAIIAQGRTTEEITILAAIFTQLGDTLATIAVENDVCESMNSNTN